MLIHLPCLRILFLCRVGVLLPSYFAVILFLFPNKMESISMVDEVSYPLFSYFSFVYSIFFPAFHFVVIFGKPYVCVNYSIFFVLIKWMCYSLSSCPYLKVVLI